MERRLYNEKQELLYRDVFSAGRIKVNDEERFLESAKELKLPVKKVEDPDKYVVIGDDPLGSAFVSAYQDFSLLFHGQYKDIRFFPEVLEVKFDGNRDFSRAYASFFHSLNLKQYGDADLRKAGEKIIIEYDGRCQTRKAIFDFSGASSEVLNFVYDALQNLKTD